MRCIAIIAIAILSSCTEFPEVDAALDRNEGGDFPTLLSFDDLLTTETPRLSAESDAALLARARALRSRATALRRPVIDRATRARMDKGINAG